MTDRSSLLFIKNQLYNTSQLNRAMEHVPKKMVLNNDCGRNSEYARMIKEKKALQHKQYVKAIRDSKRKPEFSLPMIDCHSVRNSSMNVRQTESPLTVNTGRFASETRNFGYASETSMPTPMTMKKMNSTQIREMKRQAMVRNS